MPPKKKKHKKRAYKKSRYYRRRQQITERLLIGCGAVLILLLLIILVRGCSARKNGAIKTNASAKSQDETSASDADLTPTPTMAPVSLTVSVVGDCTLGTDENFDYDTSLNAYYENYGADAILSGADPIYIPLVPPEYHFDMSLVEKGFQDGAKAIIVCNPSNPCGKVFSREELMGIGELAVKYDAFVVTDEVYEHMVYAPYHHTCMASLPGMYEHTITCNSLSKTYSITGWRLGYLIGPEEVIEAAKKVHDFLTVGAAAPLQEAATVGLNFPGSYYTELLETYTKKRAYFLDGLDRIGLKHNVPQGTYFVLIDIQEFLDLPQFAGYTDLEFCEWMIKNIGVAAVPGSSFFKEDVNHLIRLHFAREEATIDEALERLSKLKELLK